MTACRKVLILSILLSLELEIFAPPPLPLQLIDSSLVKRQLCWIFLPLCITKHWLFALPHPPLGHLVNTEVGEPTAKAKEKGQSDASAWIANSRLPV